MKKYLAVLILIGLTTELWACPPFCGPMQNLSAFEYVTRAAQASDNYRGGDREKAKKYLRSILKKNPGDPYARQFLGALFLMDGNLEASLKYWNPFIEQIRLQPTPPVDPEFMDRAFVMSPASALTYEDYMATESRLQMMGIFRKQKFRLKPLPEEGKFDLVLHPTMKKSAFSSKMKIATLVAQGTFAETVKLEFPNIAGTTINSSSMISWDEYKNRLYSSLSLPFGKHPELRFRVFTDTRRETWALNPDANLLKWEGGLEFRENVNSRWSWNSGAKVSYRSYDNISSQPGSVLQEGWLLQGFGSVEVSMLRIPERRFTLKSISSAEAGRFFGSEISPSLTLENSVELRWFPKPVGDDLALTARLRAGKMFGTTAFDEYFLLGVERDTDLLLRAHKSSIQKRGENPFAPAYILSNLDISKIIFDRKHVCLRLTPFFDVGKISDSELWQENLWLADTGIELGIQLFGASELILTYGKDLRTGRNVMYLASWRLGI